MYSQDQRTAIYKRVCDGIANKLPLHKICAQDGMPTKETVRVWLLEDADFSAQYARAREARADVRSEFIDEITDEVRAGTLDPNAARVIIDAEKWQAGKENSKRYGDKLQLDGDVNMKLPDDQLDARIAHILGKAGIAGAVRGEGSSETSA